MKKGTKRRPLWLLFIDFKSAYDRVDRKILYEKLKELKIINKKEIQMLKFLHHKMRVTIGSSECKTQLGVPQGSTISPLLFNIFLNELLSKTKLNKSNCFNQFGFADDLLFMTQYSGEIKQTVTEIEEWCSQSGMKLNKKKSAILIMLKNNKDILKDEYKIKKIKEVPVVKTYRYLGIHLNEEANMDEHLKKMNMKIGMIKSKMFYIVKKNSIRFKRNTFEVFISPLFLQLAGLYIYLRTQDKNKIISLWKKSFKSFMGINSKSPNIVFETLKPMKLNLKCIEFHQRIKAISLHKFNRKLSCKPFQRQKILKENIGEHNKLKINKENISDIIKLTNKIGKDNKSKIIGIKTKDIEMLIGTKIEEMIKVSLDPSSNPTIARKIRWSCKFSREELIEEINRTKNENPNEEAQQ